MKLSHLAFALCATLAASSAWAHDSDFANSTKDNDLRDLDLLVVTGATLDADSQRWAEQAAAASSGSNNDVGSLATIIVTGTRQGGDSQRWY